MTGPIAQLVALACHFNGLARGLRVGPFFPANSTCRFCEFIRFVRPKRNWLLWAGEATAPTPDAWSAEELRAGRAAIILHQSSGVARFSDRMTSGFVGGGGRWRLGLTTGSVAHLWEPGWEVGNRDAPDQRIWRVTYRLVGKNAPTPGATSRPLSETRTGLTQALTEIRAFAQGHGINSFLDSFETALKCLSSDDPLALIYHKDLAPEGLLDLPARQVLAACQAAWVFGGMGSWNDMSFDGEVQREYEAVSDVLFDRVNEGICAATNSAAITAQ